MLITMVNVDQLENLGKSQLGKALNWEFFRVRNLLLGTQSVLSTE